MKALALAALLALACGPAGTVTRVADGAREEGRYIDAVAYSDYARAALFEAAGNYPAALDAYREAQGSDGDSPEIWTRIGAVECRMAQASKRKDASRALSAFREALDRDDTYAAAYAERASCLEALGRKPEALDAARRAVRYDPERVELSEQVARLLFASGRAEEAWVWLEALVARQPGSPRAWQTFERAAVSERDVVRMQRANRAEVALGLTPSDHRPSPRLPDDTLDALLLAGELKAARAAAVARRVRPSALAVRAAELGVLDVALEQALLVLRADPSDADAWVTVLYASQRAGTAEQYEETLRAQAGELDRLSPPAAALFERVLEQRAGGEAARAFHDAYAARGESRAQ